MSGASSEDNNTTSSDKTELWEKERLKRLSKEQADQQRRMENMQKRMDLFENVYDVDGLKINDFKLFEKVDY